ncbi:MAG: phosphatase PAP2 family protein [Actinobacteria bacterium]|nr:phosphatase PAP2 family protein [Actinomycetota bacterium]MCA1720923.1 phosphatase PAP2 family protein [Actinomycetota bacterium]
MTAFDTRPSLLVRVTPRLLSAAREITLLTSVFVLYEVGRHLVRHRAGLAFADAGQVLSLERNLPFPSETWLQHLLLHSGGLTRAANVFYVSVHFPATIAFLIWMWLCRPRAYTWARSVLVSVTLVALMLHVTFPLAPPRMLSGEGFIDTMAVYGPSAYGEGTETVTNQYAAMPSLHAAWAIFVGVALVAVLGGRWRWLFVLHPVLTVLVVVGTGNHYWLDVVAAGALVLLAMLVHGFAPAAAGPVSAPPQRLVTS